MRIVLDAMGSDNAPGPEIAGAVTASLQTGAEIILVGDEAVLAPALAKHPKRGYIRIVHASEHIAMTDSPVLAVKKKKDSSLLVGLRLVKSGEADAFVSCGNTGAVMVGARVVLRAVQGVSRSALCQTLPTLKHPCVILDLGANVDCTARQICEFAEMGTVYAKRVVGIENPRVGLLNIGEEQAKGNEISKRVHTELNAAPHVNFIGNIEPKALYRGEADVVVCDGFVGNVVLKSSEAVAMLITNILRREAKSTFTAKLGALLMRGAFQRLKRTIDPNEQASGALLIGIQGLVFILHGASTARGVENAILGAERAAKADINTHIRRGIEELRATEVTIGALDDELREEVS